MTARSPYPVVHLREPWFESRFEFQNRIIEDWELEVYNYPPIQTTVQKHNGCLELARKYQVSDTQTAMVPLQMYESDFKGRWVCGIDALNRPCGTFAFPWDIVLHGHKSCDVDSLYGKIPLTVDVRTNMFGPDTAFPLRHWSDEHLWQYIEENEVPVDLYRYDHPEDKSANTDWVAGCTRCMDRDGPKVVVCPKLNVEIPNVSDQLVYTEPEFPMHFDAETKPGVADDDNL